MKYDLLVYLGLGVVIAGIIAGAYILRQTTAADVETSRIRFAAATSTGLLLAFIFTAILYFVDPSGPGKAIFDTAIAPIFSPGGAIIGSFFGKANNR